MAKDTTHVGYKTWRNQTGTEEEASSLLMSFCSTRSCSVVGRGLRKKSTNSLTQAQPPLTTIMTCVARQSLGCNSGMNVKGFTTTLWWDFQLISQEET